MASSNATTPVWEYMAAGLRDLAPSIPMYIHMVVGVIIPIYLGAHASLSRPSSAAKPAKRRPKDSSSEQHDDEDEEEEAQEMIGWTVNDAIVLPITAAVCLTGLYYIITRYGTDILNKVLRWYYILFGVFAVTKLVNDGVRVLDGLIFPNYYYHAGRMWKVTDKRKAITVGGQVTGNDKVRASPLPGLWGRLPLPAFVLRFLWALREKSREQFVVKGFLRNQVDFRTVLTRLNVLATSAGVAMIVLYVYWQPSPWWLTNVQVAAMTYVLLQTASPTSFGIGSLVLTGMLLYDIIMVFYTPFMETVALNISEGAPVMMEFPGPLLDSPPPGAPPGTPPRRQTSRIGGGDLVVPGLMISLALRFDLYMFYLKKQKKSFTEGDGPAGSNRQEIIEKSPYVSVTRLWADKFWTMGANKSSLPDRLSGFFPKTYFTVSIAGYVVGLIVTLAVGRIWQHGQPALFYLVPAVLVSLWGTALIRGEFKEMREFSEGITADQLEDENSNTGTDQKGDKQKDDAQPQTWKSWIWDNVFGVSSTNKANTKEEVASDKTQTAEASAPTHAHVKDNKADTDQDLLFSFSIRRRTTSSPKSGKATGHSETPSASKFVDAKKSAPDA